MKHRVVDLYQVCSDCGPMVQNSFVARGFGFKTEIYIKSSTEVRQSQASELVQEPIRHGRLFPWLYWTKHMQTQAKFLHTI